MSQDTDAVAIIAALNAALPAAARAYDLDTLPSPRPATYVEVDLSRRYVPDRLASGEATLVCGRLITGYIAKTVSNARELRRIVTATLEDKAIGAVGPFVFEADDSISESDGWFVGSDSWTF